jgi:isocitrate dehydrogenase
MQKISVAYGDGIGPEVTSSVIKILKAAEVQLEYELIELGEKVYLQGSSNGISDIAWESILNNKILLKGPITTPLGGGYKSVNVTLRKKLGLFANVRPVTSYPFIEGNGKKMDLVIVRENEEDLYAGIEYQTTNNSYLALKLVTVEGCYKIINYAFNYAVTNGRKKVTCMTKNNIMKLSDGAFARIFAEVAKNYPQIETHHMIVDIGSARVASKPGDFDVIVTLNLYGDILSDIAAEAAGAVGIAGSANLGKNYAMFEAVHGSAPDIAGQDKANPSGLLKAATMMLEHLNRHDKASMIEAAWLETLEAGNYTKDLYRGKGRLVSTTDFTQSIIDRIKPHHKVIKPSTQTTKLSEITHNKTQEKIVGCDIYLKNYKAADKISSFGTLKLHAIASKGLVLDKDADLSSLDFLQLRFLSDNTSYQEIVDLQFHLLSFGYEITLVSFLHSFDGKDGFSKGQGE